MGPLNNFVDNVFGQLFGVIYHYDFNLVLDNGKSYPNLKTGENN